MSNFKSARQLRYLSTVSTLCCMQLYLYYVLYIRYQFPICPGIPGCDFGRFPDPIKWVGTGWDRALLLMSFGQTRTHK
jgi:hypothetical protein